MTPFLNSEPIQFFTTVDRLSDFYTNFLLQNIGLTVPNSKEDLKETATTRETTTRREVKSQETKKKGLFARLFRI